MAKGRKPQFSFDDLQRAAMAMFGGVNAPTRNPQQAMGQAMNRTLVDYLDPRDFGKPNNMATDVWDYGNPLPTLTAEETRRLIDQGGRPDQGHLASLALTGALLGGNKVIRRAYGAGQRVFKEKGVKPTKPGRKQSASTVGTFQDPMGIEALYSALVTAMNRR